MYINLNTDLSSWKLKIEKPEYKIYTKLYVYKFKY